MRRSLTSVTNHSKSCTPTAPTNARLSEAVLFRELAVRLDNICISETEIWNNFSTKH